MKLTKQLIQSILNRQINDCTGEELKSIFEFIGFRLKEMFEGVGKIEFEIHYKRDYVIQVVTDIGSRCVDFRNDYINFGDETSGISMPIDNVKSLILITFNLWLDKLKINYQGIVYKEEFGYTEDEMESLAKCLNKILFN